MAQGCASLRAKTHIATASEEHNEKAHECVFYCAREANIADQAGVSLANPAAEHAYTFLLEQVRNKRLLLRIAMNGRKLPTPVLSGSGRGCNLSPTYGAPLFLVAYLSSQ